jgi:hypothetical protein
VNPKDIEMINMTDLVDNYADLHAQINELTAKAEALKAELIATGEKQVRGTFVKATISVSAPRVTVDYKGLVAELAPPEPLIQAHTKVGAPVTSVRLYAR